MLGLGGGTLSREAEILTAGEDFQAASQSCNDVLVFFDRTAVSSQVGLETLAILSNRGGPEHDMARVNHAAPRSKAEE